MMAANRTEVVGESARRGDAVTPVAPAAVPRIRIERVAESRWVATDWSRVPFGSVYSDHMLVAEFEDGRWGEPVVRPYGPLPLPPSISALHYGVSVFEGLKAHRSPEGEVLVFRPRDNARRLQRSAARLAMPEVPEALFMDGLKALLRLDQRWVPAHGSGALYIRPVLFSVDSSIRVKPAERFLFVIFTCPFAGYYGGAVDVLVTRRYVRAYPGGTGDTKPAGNYAPTFVADVEARTRGCQSVLWLDGREHRYVEESGVMNVFFVIGDRVVTPELGGTILPGLTRDSVITLLRAMGHHVEERRVAIDEIAAAHAAGRLRECFGTGTAATLSHVGRILNGSDELLLPPVEARTVGPAVRERLVAIMEGRAPDEHGWRERV
jgi:branched-chain amino acid aminotransferase